jgi:maltooligosyltrehalose trehalohydrolase
MSTHLRAVHGPQPHADGTTTFSLWAPAADEVELVLGPDGEDTRQLMEQLDRGWWRSSVRAGHGDRYGFSLDGGPVRPDPASRWLPDGVHGRSAVLDHGALGVTPAPSGWRATSVLDGAIYELHIGTFTDEGTFDAAAERIRHLPDLGITHVEVMPVNAFNGDRGWGYDGVQWYAVHEAYGGPEGFARLVAACHDAGLGVLLDVVHNHLGPSGNHLPEFGPHLGKEGDWGHGLNLDGPQSDPVRDLVIGNAVFWCRDYGVDGLRLDAVHALHDESATHVLTELAAAVDALAHELDRPLELIAESDRNDPKTIRPRELGGFGMTAQWADELHHALHIAVTGEHEGYYVDTHPDGLPDVATAYRRGFVHDGSRYSGFRERTPGAPLADSDDGRRLIGCIQNHDQVGNRAAGERLLSLTDPALVRVAALLLCAAPHTPMLFMGEEHGETNPFMYFTSHPEPELAEAVRTGRAEEFAGFSSFSGAEVPDPQALDTFERSRVDWSKTDTAAGRAWTALWTDLLALRRSQPALCDGRFDLVTIHRVGADVLSVQRGGGDGVLVVANTSDEPVTLAAPGADAPLLSTADPRYGGDGDVVRVDDGEVALPPRTAAILSVIAG